MIRVKDHKMVQGGCKGVFSCADENWQQSPVKNMYLLYLQMKK